MNAQGGLGLFIHLVFCFAHEVWQMQGLLPQVGREEHLGVALSPRRTVW